MIVHPIAGFMPSRSLAQCAGQGWSSAGRVASQSTPTTSRQHSPRQFWPGKSEALKGLGGYHLVCDAGNGEAVMRLRRRKQREEKPLALMLADVAAARRICQISSQEQALLESAGSGRSCCSLGGRAMGASAIADTVAPGNPNLGVMLPYTPLHHLLMDRVGEFRWS